MTIALPICQDRVSPVLDTAARLLVVSRHQGREVERREIVLSPLPPEELARSVAELRVNVLLCAAVSETLLRALEKRRVRVVRHLCGETEALLQAFCRGRFRQREFRMPGCWGWHPAGGCCPRRRAENLVKSGMKTHTK